MTLVAISCLAQPTLELHRATLLHDMSRLVSGRVQIRRLLEGHMIARGIRLGTKLPGSQTGLVAQMSLDVAHIMVAEGRLDRAEKRQIGKDE